MKKLLLCLTLALSICQNVIFLARKTFLHVGRKLPYLGIFVLELEEATVLWYFTSTPSNHSKHKILTKNKKIINFGTKFGKSKSNVVFEINTLEFAYM